MKNNLVIPILVLMLVSCGEKEKEPALPSDLKYTILSEKVNNKLNKDNVDVELTRNITKEELTVIANELRETRKQYDKLWIAYFLKGTDTRNLAYAVSNFTPELSVSISGATRDQKDRFAWAADSVDGKIIGKWREEAFTASTFVFFEKNGKFFSRQIIKEGVMPNKELKKSMMGKQTKYQEKGNAHGEYFVIGEQGELQFYDKNGKFAVGIKM